MSELTSARAVLTGLSIPEASKYVLYTASFPRGLVFVGTYLT